jgi:predicted metal-dependent HD superfamily phosphohydrolase
LTHYQNKNIFEKLGHGAIQKKFAQFFINTFRQFKVAVNKSHFFRYKLYQTKKLNQNLEESKRPQMNATNHKS